MIIHEKRTNTAGAEETNLRLLLENIKKMQIIHETGHTCYADSREWQNCAYGWHNPLFPPEYRACCLKGESFTANPSSDLYYFMACYYETITGQKAPYNFELDHIWKERLFICFKERGSVYGTAVLHIIANCTRWKKRKRIQNAGELLKTEDIRVLTDISAWISLSCRPERN